MRKSLNKEIKRLLIKYYKTNSNNNISDFKREKRLKRIEAEISEYPKIDIINTAKILSKSRNRPYIFKVWCDIIVLYQGVL